MTLKIKAVAAKKDIKKFIFLPEKIHASHKTWVPPIYLDEWRYFNPQKNPAFKYCDTLLLLAFDGGIPVGRAMGIINHRHNSRKNERTARFACLESHENIKVVHGLLTRIEDWAREKGMNKVIGPYGFSDQDPEGFLIDGFEHRATIVTYHNFEWMPGFVVDHGYSKEIDYVVYRISVGRGIPEVFQKMKQRILKRGNLEILEARRKKDLKPWMKDAFRLLNESYVESEIFGFDVLDEKEVDDLIKRYLPIVDPRFVKGVKKGDELVGFVIGIPDITGGIQKAGGRLFPFGFYKILRAGKKTRQFDLLLGAIKKEYRGLGADILQITAMSASLQKAGFELIDTHHQMETNKKMRAVFERLGEVYKRFRVYRKEI